MVIIIIIILSGLAVGSFLNVIIFRLREKKGFIKGRSTCLKCHKKISWHDNIPLLSFILLKGKCRYCRAKISWQYPVVELVTAILFLSAFFINFQFSIFNFQTIFNFQFSTTELVYLFRDIVFISVLIVIFVYDLRWYLILDVVTLPAIIIAVIFNLFLGFSFLNLLLAVVIGAGFFLLQFIISKGRWIGGGDIRLGALMGAMLGWPQIIVAFFIAYIVGSVIGVGLMISGKKTLSSKVPFGTFLSFATVISLFWGREILNWYLSFY